MFALRASYWLTFASVLGATSIGSAHAPAKVLQYLSTKPDDVLLVTNRGLIFGNQQTRDFKLLCNEAYDVPPAEETVRFARLEGGRLLVASSNGLFSSDDRGCTWQENAALKGLSVPTLTQDANDATGVYVATYTMEAPFTGTLRRSQNGGESFDTLYSGLDEYLRAVLVAPGRLYFSAMGLGATRSHYVARSSDGGATWERTTLMLEAEELDVTLLAVNPKQPDELLARASASEPGLGERLLWSRDGGRTFTSLGKVKTLMHATFADDGSVAYVGSIDGLQRVSGAATERKLEPVGTTARISQVREQAGDIFASGYYQGIEAGLDGIGVAKAENLTFERWMSFNEVDEQVACSPALERTCRAWWEDWQRENPSPYAADAGSADAGVSSDAGMRGMDASRPATSDARTSGEADAQSGQADAATGGDREQGGKEDGCNVARGPLGGLLHALPWLAALAWRRRRAA